MLERLGQEEKGTTEDETVDAITDSVVMMQTLGVSEGQESLVCCSSWGCKESDMTQQPNSNSGSSVNSDS